MDASHGSFKPLAAGCFPPMALALDDRLDNDLQLVLGHRHRIDPVILEQAVKVGLEAFPHLTGNLLRDGGDAQWWIVPAAEPAGIELVEDGGPFAIADLHAMPVRELARSFLPAANFDDGTQRLFSLRWTRCQDGDVLGLRVSHAAVDGTGLGWFAHCCTAGARGEAPPPVKHDRRDILTTSGDDTGAAPPGYRDVGRFSADWRWPPDPWAAGETLFFEIPASSARSVMCVAGSLLDLRLGLAGWLCHRLAEIAPQLNELAVWCDPRGGGFVPRHFTGNAGCYRSIPLREQPPHQLAAYLKQLSSRRGLQRTAETYRQIKCAEAHGRMVVWNGPREDILQLNLLPRSAANAGFGGTPDFSRLLTRNSSGLRVSCTPDDGGFLIEASLASGWGEALLETARHDGLDPCQRNRGDHSNPRG